MNPAIVGNTMAFFPRNYNDQIQNNHELYTLIAYANFSGDTF